MPPKSTAEDKGSPLNPTAPKVGAKHNAIIVSPRQVRQSRQTSREHSCSAPHFDSLAIARTEGKCGQCSGTAVQEGGYSSDHLD